MTRGIEITVRAIEREGKCYVSIDMQENETSMKLISLAIYKMKQIEQELLDREWEGGNGYEIFEDKRQD